MFGGLSEDHATLDILLSDLKDLSRWEESKVLLLRSELKEVLRKGALPKLLQSFEASMKSDSGIVLDDAVDLFSKLCSLSVAEGLSLAYCFLFAQSKNLISSARRFITTKLQENQSQLAVGEISEEIRNGLVTILQSDEEFRSSEWCHQLTGLLRESVSTFSPGLLPSTGLLGSKGGASLDFMALSRFTEPARPRAISSTLEEYGGSASASADNLRKIIASTGQRVDEEQMAGILIAVLPKPPTISAFDDKVAWNYEVVAEVLQDVRNLNWALVVKHLDNPKLVIRSETDFQILIKLVLRISGASFPPAGLLQGLWTNVRAQFAMLALTANSPRAVVDYSPFVTQDQILAGEGIPTPLNYSWVCHPLYARLLDIATAGLTMEVLEVLMKAAANYPEYVLTSLASIPETGVVRQEVIQRLMVLFLGFPGSRSTSPVVMRKLYSTNPDLLFRLCYVAFKKATKASEIIQTETLVRNMGGQYLRRLEVDSNIDELLGYWCIRFDRQEINLEEKLSSTMEAKHIRFVIAFCKQFGDGLRSRAISTANDGILSIESYTVLLRMMQQFSAVVPPEDMKALLNVYNQYQQSLQFGTGSTHYGAAAQGDNEMRLPPGPESEEIENLANAYFQKIYTTDITIQDVVHLLRQFKTSTEKKEQELFRCMVHNLFDEYRFFHKYPEKELQITARLFGSLVQHQLVSSITLGIALRYVLEALRKDPELGEGNDKMFRFGQLALEQFRMRLAEWPQYCSHLIQIPHLSRQNPDLFQEAQRALSSPQQSHPGSSAGAGGGFHGGFEHLQQQQPSVGSSASSGYLGALPTQQQPSTGFGFLSSTAGLSNVQPNSLSLQFNNLSVGGLSGGTLIGSPELSGSKPLLNSFAPPLSLAAAEFNPGALSVQSQVQVGGVSTASVMASFPKESVGTGSTEPSGDSEIEMMLLVNLPVSEQDSPSDTMRDSVHFIINNVAKSNLETKAHELREALKPELFPWFANYLVEKRISSQPNLHSLYLTMLDVIDSSDLNKLILDSTLFNVTKFLASPNITSSTSERSILRHFGMWLGQITLAKSRPLLLRRINLKKLIFWGYESGRLIAVCSFVAKVLEGVKDSKVFRPPNPWLMAILGVLKELSEVEDLKLNIKFEVQVLFKNILIKLEDVTKTNLLPSCPQPVKDHRNPDFNFKVGSTSTATASSAPLAVATPVAKEVTKVTSANSITVESSTTLSVESVNVAISQALSGVVINPSLQYFVGNPTQRRTVITAVEKGIKEICMSAIDRSVALATATAKQLILKDFSTEGDDTKLRLAAHTMVSSLAGSLSVAISKEPLRISIGNHLRTLLAPAISDQTVIEQIVQVCANENLELGCALIEKASVDKSIKDIDDMLSSAFVARRKSRETNQPYSDASITQLSTKFPLELQELLKLNPAGVTPLQMSLYENFQKFTIATAQSGSGAPGVAADARGGAQALSMSQALEAYQLIYTRLDQTLKNLQVQHVGREITLAMLGEHEITQLIKDLVVVTQRTQATVRNETALTFSETIFNRMFESTSNPNPLRLEVFVAVLEAVREACGGVKVFNPDFFTWLTKHSSIVSDDLSRRVYRHILLLLLRVKLLKAVELDAYLVMHMEGGNNVFWLELALMFVKQCVTDPQCGVAVYDFSNTIDAISQMRPTNPNVRKMLQKWLLEIRAFATPTPATDDRSRPAAVVAPPAPARDAAVKQHVASLIERWLGICSNVTDQLFAQYLQLLNQFGVLRNEEAADKFFRISFDICCEASLKNAVADGEQAGVVNFMFIDGLSKLFLLLVRVVDKESGDTMPRGGINLLARILNCVAKAIIENSEARKQSRAAFDQRPYYRMLSNLLQDLNLSPEDKQDPNVVLPLILTHAQCYLAIQPSVVPSFAFSWLILISKRSFMPYLVRSPKGWSAMHKILISLFQFLQPYLKAGVLPDVLKRLYKGTLRIMLVLLHDFPEFLCDFYLSLCDAIPSNCVQLRNLVLSAFPRSMRLPDPFTPNLRLDTLPEASQPPRLMVDFSAILGNLRSGIDSYLTNQLPLDFSSQLTAAWSSSGTLNITLISVCVVYIGGFATAVTTSKHQITTCYELLREVLLTLDPEGRYLLLGAFANQLRYPNSHTSYFSGVLLALFADVESEFLQEQITRVLLERLIAHRPHPWGLLITFIELIKNPKFAFWRKSFTRSSPDIERVFESIARSCLGTSATAVISSQTSL